MMIEKTWFQQDFFYIGFSRGAFIAFIIYSILYTILCYKLGVWKGNGALKRFWWRWFWWVYYAKR